MLPMDPLPRRIDFRRTPGVCSVLSREGSLDLGVRYPAAWARRPRAPRQKWLLSEGVARVDRAGIEPFRKPLHALLGWIHRGDLQRPGFPRRVSISWLCSPFARNDGSTRRLPASVQKRTCMLARPEMSPSVKARDSNERGVSSRRDNFFQLQSSGFL